MKIAFLINDLGAGGAERAVTGLANYWVGKHDIVIITFVKATPFYHLDPKISLRYCLEKPKSHSSILRSAKDIVLRFSKLNKHLKILKPDVVISFMLTANIYALRACKWQKIPCIISERSNHAIAHIAQLQKQVRDISYSHSARLMVQTSGNRDYYTKIVPLNKITVIPNAIASDLTTKRKYSRLSREKLILNVGSFKNGKAQDVLIRAFAKLPESDWKLIFLGKGSNLEKFKGLSQDLGVADRITFAGAQKEVAAYYNKAGIFVFTSEHEGFPNALLEALYFGLPSISTNCPHGPADMITDGENGFLVPIGDVKTLAQKIELLMNDETLRQDFSKKALESTKKYEMEAIAAQWMKVIEEVV